MPWWMLIPSFNTAKQQGQDRLQSYAQFCVWNIPDHKEGSLKFSPVDK